MSTKKQEENIDGLVDFKKWFGEKWVNIGAKPKNGEYPACGRKKAKKGRKGYPKCVPRSKARSMSKSEIKSGSSQKA